MYNKYNFLFFKTTNILEKLQKQLPIGIFYQNAYNIKSNFYKYLKWLSFCLESFYTHLDTKYKGIFIEESDYFVEKFRTNYNIPNSKMFVKNEYMVDIYVLNYLTYNNRLKTFQIIANAYGIRVKIKSWSNNRITIKFFTKTKARYLSENNKYVSPLYDFFYFENAIMIKIRYFYDLIKPVNLKIEYQTATDYEINNYKADPEEPDFISLKIAGKYVQYKTN